VSTFSQAQRAYSPKVGAIRTSRSIEFEVIARITHRLRVAIEANDRRKLIEVLYENRTLWTALAADVASSKNSLPKELKAQLFYLSEFTVQHTRKVLKRQGDANALLNINISILKGLKFEGDTL